VSYVRKKIVGAGAPDPIRTVRGVGYSFEAR
jgi:DNA-binding response OmpR family regulator